MGSPLLHLDEARSRSIAALQGFLAAHAEVERAVLVDDLFGAVRVVVWVKNAAGLGALEPELRRLLEEAGSQLWSGDLWIAGSGTASEDQFLHDAAWDEGAPVDPTSNAGRLRLNDRHRNRSSWFLPLKDRETLRPEGLTEDEGAAKRTRIVVFHSFKGGVGRTTSLAAYALAHARRSERVAIVDMDLDAPGIGRLLDVDGEGTTARWGVVDYLLEAKHPLELSDYFHTCAREALTSPGLIEVFPGGQLDDGYLGKLARVDLEVGRTPAGHPLFALLKRIELERKPSMILVDGRAGLSPGAGLVLSGFADLHVLFATVNPQSLQGLNRVIRHLGNEQARHGRPQLECVVVQALVPEDAAVAAQVQEAFAGQILEMFESGYYAKPPARQAGASSESQFDDALWTLDDLDSSVAPHRPVAIRYRASIASSTSIDQIGSDLLQGDHALLAERLDQRLGMSHGQGT